LIFILVMDTVLGAEAEAGGAADREWVSDIDSVMLKAKGYFPFSRVLCMMLGDGSGGGVPGRDHWPFWRVAPQRGHVMV
jgi:hypothetical protein